MWAALISFFSSGVGNVVGKAVTTTATTASIIAVLMWFTKHSDENVACLTWGTLALFALLMVPMVLVIYLTRAGTSRNRE